MAGRTTGADLRQHCIAGWAGNGSRGRHHRPNRKTLADMQRLIPGTWLLLYGMRRDRRQHRHHPKNLPIVASMGVLFVILGGRGLRATPVRPHAAARCRLRWAASDLRHPHRSSQSWRRKPTSRRQTDGRPGPRTCQTAVEAGARSRLGARRATTRSSIASSTSECASASMSALAVNERLTFNELKSSST